MFLSPNPLHHINSHSNAAASPWPCNRCKKSAKIQRSTSVHSTTISWPLPYEQIQNIILYILYYILYMTYTTAEGGKAKFSKNFFFEHHVILIDYYYVFTIIKAHVDRLTYI